MLKKIVIAEDDDAIAHMVGMALGDAGFLCIRARDGHEALQLTKMHQPDVLVLDIMMPNMDGREVAKRLKEDALLSKIPILMLTALSDVDSKVAGLNAGADDYVSKPFDLRELEARIRALIRSSQRERDRNGTTDLPGSLGIEKHIRAMLSEDEAMVVLQIGVHDFAAFMARVGHSESLDYIKRLASFLLTELRNHDGGFLGHLGGTDFVTSCEASKLGELAEALVSGFDTQQYSEPASEPASQPLCLVIGAAHSAAQDEETLDEETLREHLASSTRRARNAKGSNYVLWSE